MRSRVGNKAVGQIVQLFLVMLASFGFEVARADKCSDSSSRLHNSQSLQFGIHFRHGVGVYAQIDSQLPHGRQLIAGAQLSGSHGEPDCPLKLGVERHRVRIVDEEHLAHFTIVLRQ